MKHRALIIGGGRIAIGFNWPGFPFPYTHLEAYKALSDRVEVVGVVEPNDERRAFAQKLGLNFFSELPMALKVTRPDIVSICTPDNTHEEVFKECILLMNPPILGYWIEKPFSGPDSKRPIQVNYCRRFDKTHQAVAELLKGRKSHLFVWARNDLTTRCHFGDLARWWKAELIYMDNTGESPSTNSYRIECGKWAMEFRNGGVEGEFMTDALANLLDVVDGKPGAQLLSPPYAMERA